jgi:ribosomal-protein-alanine N-acetyltransferase
MTNHAGITIRPMGSEDIPRIIQIADQLPHAPHWPANVYQSALNPNAEPLRLALVAQSTASNQVVGFIVASLIAGEAELESIAVALDFQRQGLGAQLLTNLIASLHSAAVFRINLEVRASNHQALALYARHGFTQTARRTAYYADPVEDAVLMHLDLA